MSKQILPAELAELVCGLLLDPNILGELDSQERHQAFMLDIGRAIADHCGGHINGINGPELEEGYLQEELSSPTLSVSPNDSLPSINKCIWSYFDPDGWEDEEIEGIETGEPLGAAEVAKIRSQLQGLLSNNGLADNSAQTLSFSMVDWRISEGMDLEEPTDNRKYLVNATLNNQPSIEFFDERGEPCFGLIIEINHGAPKIQVSANGQDITLQVHAAHGGLVLTPEELGAMFEDAPVDRFSYNDPSSILLRQGLTYEELTGHVTKFYEANHDDGHGLPFSSYSEWDRKSLIAEGVENYKRNGSVKIRSKYVIAGGFNTLNEKLEWENQ